MTAGSNALSYEKFSVFMEDVDKYCASSKGSVMDTPLLHLVKNAFGYRTVTLSNYYGGQFRDVQVIGNLATERAKEIYLNGFQKRDPFAAHINRTCEVNPQTSTLQSSAVFSQDYFTNEYHRFLRGFGVWWALALPVGHYRLTLYKHEDESDFSTQEREALKLLNTLLRGRYQAKQELDLQKASEAAHSRLLDSAGIGLVVADHRMKLVDGNQTAADFLCKTYNSSCLQFCLDRLFETLRDSGARKAGINPLVTMDFTGHAVAMEMVEGNTEADRLYSITVMPHAQPAGAALPGVPAADAFGLTEREVEIGRMLVGGKSYQETADALFVSINTVRTHVRNIYKKTGINNQRMLGQLLR